MTIELPDHEIGSLNLTSAQARLDFAVGLYTGKRASMGRAAKVAGVAYAEFLHELGRRGISINYSTSDFEHDLKAIEVFERARE